MAFSNRVQSMMKHENQMKRNSLRARANPYHSVENPQGTVNLGTAENQLIAPTLLNKLQQNSSINFEPWMQYYFDAFGIKSLRVALSKFIRKRFRAAHYIDPENIYVTLGAAAANDLLYYIITDPGDCVLIPAPFYAAMEGDMVRDETKFIPVYPRNEEFRVTSLELEDAHAKAKAKGLNVKAVAIVNPDNPTGISRNREEMLDLLRFAAKHDLHTVVSEIYALSSFTPDNPFCSILSIPELPLPEKTHFLWAFSKDFGLSGFRCAVIYTKLDLSKLMTLFFMETPPSIVQQTLADMISDEKWLDECFFPDNQNALAKGYATACSELRSMGVEPFKGFNAAFFVWADFGQILKSRTFEEETELVEKFLEAGVYIIPGGALRCPFPGWFRITFTYSTETLITGLSRVKDGIAAYKEKSA